MGKYLDGLNPPQLEAATHMEGPLMIVAGAGSGKTKVLTTRIAHLMANGVDAFNILALTFTNKAAAEMKLRIENLLQSREARNLYIGTFHSVFARILRTEGVKLGYPSNFTIYDTDDSRTVIKAVVKELNLDEKHYKPNNVHIRISQAKNALVGPMEYQQDYYIQQEDQRSNRPAIGKIYQAYAERCFNNGAMDFDDLLLKMHELLHNFPDVRHKYQHKFKFILIDEFQDTNPVQYEIAKLLAAVHENICVVGDDAQSIYSFRGATIENILQFQKDYDDVKLVKLEQNYRSSKSIIEVANEIIKNNKGQIPKNLWTENVDGETIKLVRTMTDNDEGRFVADIIKEQRLRNHFFNNDFAILYRTNAQSRAFEESLRKHAIPYKIYGGLSFYQRKEIKDFICYLRITVNTKDEEALKRIINYPVRGIGKTTVEKALVMAHENKSPLFNILGEAHAYGFKGSTLESIKNFVTMIQYFQTLLKQKNAYEVAVQIGKHTQITKELFNDKTTEGLARYENIQELLNSIKEWTETPDNEDGEVVDKSLGAYLQQITLLTDADTDQNGDADTVKLMTVHAAKGLEFPVVFIGGMEEGLFPNAMSINTREELEEERRLFYVAVTRAKQKLWITYANSRYRFGNLVQNEPSRFLEELPETFIDNSYAGGRMPSQSTMFNMGNAFQRMHRGGFGDYNDAPPSEKNERKPSYLQPKKPMPQTLAHVPSKDFAPDDTSGLQAGQRVEHQKFGFGTVIKMENIAHNPAATISFDLNGEKRILLQYAKLRIVKDNQL
ncbi:MAG: exodeoxyribonuclease V subunit gamma [Bacteroidetes bacterium]|nr:exodeoxyribonuclease V subunit gamma [Bacteroidota bacterium]